MAFFLPDGSKFFISSGFGAAINVTALSNANPAAATAAAHGLANGDELLLTSGWEEATDTPYVASGVTTNNFNLNGLDASDTNMFTPGGGVGSVKKITGWTEITQMLNIQASGGDTKYATVDLLSRKNAINLPAGFNASSLTITMADDPSLAGYLALRAASKASTPRAIKILLSGGATGYGYGYIALNEMPSLNKGQVNQVTCAISLIGKFNRA